MTLLPNAAVLLISLVSMGNNGAATNPGLRARVSTKGLQYGKETGYMKFTLMLYICIVCDGLGSEGQRHLLALTLKDVTKSLVYDNKCSTSMHSPKPHFAALLLA